MCGRFVRITSVSVLAYEVVIINEEGARQIIQCKWGFIPPWAKDPSIGYTMINVRSETIARKPAFRSAFKKKRCLVVADGFYEGRAEGKKKFPRVATGSGLVFTLLSRSSSYNPAHGGVIDAFPICNPFKV